LKTAKLSFFIVHISETASTILTSANRILAYVKLALQFVSSNFSKHQLKSLNTFIRYLHVSALTAGMKVDC
jgi:hypothetical protein